MKYLTVLLLLSGTVYLFSQESGTEDTNEPGYLGESGYYMFYSHYWLNMHHFLQHEALMRDELQKSTISDKMMMRLSAAEKDKLEHVISYYVENLIERDLRSSDYMSEFKEWMITQDVIDTTSTPAEFSEHISWLRMVDELYRTVFWPEHSAANQKILDGNLQLITDTENQVVEALSSLTRQFWQRNKIRVDITYFAKATRRNMRNRPYTTLSPTHVVMNSSEGADTPGGSWLELLYHESSHHLIGSVSGFVGGTIQDVADVADEEAPRSLWHAYLFYFAGRVTQDALEEQGLKDYEMYMVRKNVFSWYLPHLEKHLPAYMNYELTLKDATELIFADIRSGQ